MSTFQTQYRDEFIAGFEQRQSLLRNTVTTEAQIKGNSAVFLVADSGNATAQTRGANGLIPARIDSETQYTATLAEWHDLVRRTKFNIFASQGDGRRLMQETTMGVINRKIDSDILAALSSAPNDTGAAQTMSLDLAMWALTILGNNEVPLDGNISGLLTPAAYAYLMQTKEFTNVDYINNKPFESMPVAFRWAGVNWIVHPNLSGKGTASETLYLYHKSALGHAYDASGIDTDAGYNGEQAYSYCRVSVHMGSKLLQNEGIVKITHDGSKYAAL